jgi:hypothetical protein
MYTKQQISEIYRKLPQKLREIIVSPELASIVNNIAKNNNLDDKQQGKLEEIISNVLMKITEKEKMSEKLKEIGLDDIKFQKILNEVKTNILDNLEKIYLTIQTNIKNEDVKNGIEDYEFYDKENDIGEGNWFDILPEDQKTEVKNELKNSLKEKDFRKMLGGIFEYTESAPKNIKNIVADNIWPKRVAEIATKYSLTEDQTIILQNLILSVIIEVEQKENLVASLETELGISELLTEQIMKDLDERVFQYATDFIEKGGETDLPLPKFDRPDADVAGALQTSADNTATKVPVRTPFDVLGKQKEEVEIPPVILPMVESDEDRKKVAEQNRIANTERPDADVAGALRASIGNSVSPSARPVAQAPANLPGIAVEKPIIDTDNQIKDGVFIGSEFIQKPIAVPRFNATSAPENPENKNQTADSLSARINQTEKPQNIIDNKLNSVVSSTAPADKKPEVEYPPRYTVDPYREPIE